MHTVETNNKQKRKPQHLTQAGLSKMVQYYAATTYRNHVADEQADLWSEYETLHDLRLSHPRLRGITNWEQVALITICLETDTGSHIVNTSIIDAVLPSRPAPVLRLVRDHLEL